MIIIIIYTAGSVSFNYTQIYVEDATLTTFNNIKPNYSIHYEKDVPIRINNTLDFINKVELENWRGDGSKKNPYMIEGRSIINSGNLISIFHTDLYFQISNCFLSGLHPTSPGCGIFLYNVSNGFISNNVIENIDGIGIFIEKSFNNSIYENSIQRNSREGIWIDESSNIDLFGNTIVENGFVGIDIYQSDSINLTLNHVRSGRFLGIRLKNSNKNLLFRNSVFNNTDYGIHVEDSNHNDLSWNIFIKNKVNGSSQAYDSGTGNLFTENFWNEWTYPDENKDGIVDTPYEIDGFSNNQDAFPQISFLKTFYMINSINFINNNNYNQINTRPNLDRVFAVFLLVIILILLKINITKQKK